MRKIVALSEIYGAEATARALDDAFDYGAFSSDYITNLLEARARSLPEPSALHLTRRADLLELELPQPDLSLYEASSRTELNHPPPEDLARIGKITARSLSANEYAARVGARTSEDPSFPGLSPDPFPATISPIVP